MEQTRTLQEDKLVRPVLGSDNPMKLILLIGIAAIILGTLSGYMISTKNGGSAKLSPLLQTAPKTAQQDNRTFKDFAEGIIKAKPQPADPGDYVEGTHMLERVGAIPVALTSSVVDLSKYEGKKVRVFGETQKALKEGWLMDVGKVEEIK